MKGRNRYENICRYCGGRLDPGEKCDCRKMKGRVYTSIEGAGYRMERIGEQKATCG